MLDPVAYFTAANFFYKNLLETKVVHIYSLMSKRCTLVCTCKHISCGVGECCTVTVHKNKGAQCAAPGRHRVRRFTVHDVKEERCCIYPTHTSTVPAFLSNIHSYKTEFKHAFYVPHILQLSRDTAVKS